MPVTYSELFQLLTFLVAYTTLILSIVFLRWNEKSNRPPAIVCDYFFTYTVDKPFGNGFSLYL